MVRPVQECERNPFYVWARDLGVRQSDVAAAMGEAQSQITRWMTNNHWPTLAAALKIESFTAGAVSPADFLNAIISERQRRRLPEAKAGAALRRRLERERANGKGYKPNRKEVGRKERQISARASAAR